MSLVSVIMPYYKKKAYLIESINSILNQSYQDFEILLIDMKYQKKASTF